jgi:hypothetical protein
VGKLFVFVVSGGELLDDRMELLERERGCCCCADNDDEEEDAGWFDILAGA